MPFGNFPGRLATGLTFGQRAKRRGSSHDVVAGGQVTPAEKLNAALRDRGWSDRELAWVLNVPVVTAQSLMREPRLTPTLTLRLEAALELPAGDWYAAAGVPVPDLWVLQDQMEGELAAIRRRRHRFDPDRTDEGPPESCRWSSRPRRPFVGRRATARCAHHAGIAARHACGRRTADLGGSCQHRFQSANQPRNPGCDRWPRWPY